MTARELYDYLKERNAEDLPIMIPCEEGHIFLEDLHIDIYVDSVLLD
jgi:hypothetical protein